MVTSTVKTLDHSDTHKTAVISTTPWYQRPVVWVSILTGLTGAAGIIYQYYPDLAFIAAFIGVVNVILTTYETVVNSLVIVTPTQ